MLAVTDDAVQALDTIVANSELPDTAGLKLQARPESNNGHGPTPSLFLDVVLAPDPDDTRIDGAPLYVDSAAADLLADKVLDAEVHSDDIEFSIRSQAEEELG
jgi:Fe-S cluster assembly iron-binding protein IscA